jgi:hypothetical protein
MSEAGQKSDLPFGSEFSPSQIVLADLLEIVHASAGDWKALEKAVLKKYFSRHGKSGDGAYNRGKLANNCKLGMIAYGIIERGGRFRADRRG